VVGLDVVVLEEGPGVTAGVGTVVGSFVVVTRPRARRTGPTIGFGVGSRPRARRPSPAVGFGVCSRPRPQARPTAVEGHRRSSAQPARPQDSVRRGPRGGLGEFKG
jgi:hypothetical protein